MDIKQSKSILARLLATENLTVQHKNIPTAYFDVKNRVLALPTWKDMSSDLYDLLTGHEVGHALYTPANGWHDAVTDKALGPHFKGFLNVLEDARIEKLIKRRYPGLAKNFYTGYGELFEQGFFEIEEADIPDLLFIDRINIHFKMGRFYAVPFTYEEKTIVEEVERLKTWQQVYDLAVRLYGMAEDELKDKQMKFQLELKHGEGDENDDSGTPVDYTDLPEDLADEIKRQMQEMQTPESLTDRAFRNREKELVDDKSQPYFYFNLGRYDAKPFIWDYKKMLGLHKFKDYQEVDRSSLFQEFRLRNTKFVNYLIKEFELKRNAQQLARAKVTKSGEIDIKKVHQYNFSEDLFLKVTSIPKGKNHGLIMYYDMSGSMNYYMAAVLEQMLILVEFCRKVNIPFEVYGFTNNMILGQGYDWDSKYTERQPKVGDYGLETGDVNFRLQQYFSDTMSAAEYKKMFSNLLLIKKVWEQKTARMHKDFDMNFGVDMPQCEDMHSTPLNQTIMLSRDIYKKFLERTRAEIVNMVYLTDGEADNSVRYFDPELHDWRQGKVGAMDNFPGTMHANVFIKDQDSKVEVQVPRGHRANPYTTALLELTREVTGANIVGFFLTSAVKRVVEESVFGDRWRHNISATENQQVEAIMAKYKKDRVAVLTQAGFNEYYVVHAASLDIDEDEDIKGDDIKDISKNFRRMHKDKLVNRVLLNRFINMIA